ncbi:MAG: Uma2 family endonuclease, partial [Fimbriimonadaceae bacterium]|nr:Uma2 family endonuclease [Fimbriimonadaceae bacterium]
PRFVVEITSPETQRTDSIEKAAAYFETPSIESYVQVSQTALAVAVHRRDAGQPTWITERLVQPADELRLDSLGFSLALARLYRRTGLLAE